MGSTSGASSHFSAKNPVKQAALEHCQPEELNRFRSNRRIEEHLLTANLVIDKTLDSCPSCPSCAWRLPSTTIRAQTEAGKRSGAKKKNTPLWIGNLDLPKSLGSRGRHCGKPSNYMASICFDLGATNDI